VSVAKADISQAKVLIIEDDEGVALDLQWIARDMCLNVVGIARTRTEAVALAKQELPHLVLSDIELCDGSSGIDAVKDIISEIVDARIIFITGSGSLLEGNLAGKSIYVIPKPYRETVLRNAIVDALS
jgi:ActR/RegA family two-component response regulator